MTPPTVYVPESEESFNRFTPAFTADYAWTSDVSTYAKISTGYRAGGFYFQGIQPPGSDYSFKPETVTSYELGLKSYWFNRRARLNIAAFLANYDDIQMAPTIDYATVTSKMFNLGKARIEGVETELLFNPIEVLTFNVEYSYLNAKFTQVPAPACSVYDNDVTGTCAAAGKPFNPFSPYSAGVDIANLFSMPYVPKHSVDVSANYDFLRLSHGTFTAHADYRYQSDYYPDVLYGPAVPGNQFALQPSYSLVNARISYAGDLGRGHATFSLWSKNIFDNRYTVARGPVGNSNVPTPDGFGGSIPAGFTGYSSVLYAQPRTYGVTVSFEF
jgi:iron complex outermembrane receptor protein